MAYVRKCKYECGTQLLGFDEKERKYKEHPSGILHTKERCTEAKNKLGTVQNQPPQNNQDQRTKDIKDAQEERRVQHRQLIRNLQWNTKMLAHLIEIQGGKEAREILDSMGFEEFQEEQRSFENNVL
jgi:hypothetical protein